MHTLSIAHTKVGESEPIFIIAEAGVNHNGDLVKALELVDIAAEAGADAVKFQTFKAEDVVTDKGKMAEYQIKNTGQETSQQDLLRPLEFKEEWYRTVIDYCAKRGIIFLSTPHGHIPSAELLLSLGVPAFKVGSGDLTNLPLLRFLARTGKPVIISTGMSTKKEVEDAVSWFKEENALDRLVVLQCTTDYPTKPSEANVSGVSTLKQLFPDVLIGYSDHTEGIAADILAANLGAVMLEKHITADKTDAGPDQKASLDPEELKEMVAAVKAPKEAIAAKAKEISDKEMYLGTGMIDTPFPSETGYIEMARKSLVAATDIKKGELFTDMNVTVKRPETGISPTRYDEVMGMHATADIPADTTLTEDLLG